MKKIDAQIPEEDLRFLDDLADETNSSRSQIVRSLIQSAKKEFSGNAEGAFLGLIPARVEMKKMLVEHEVDEDEPEEEMLDGEEKRK